MPGSHVGTLHWDLEQILVLADGQTPLCLGGSCSLLDALFTLISMFQKKEDFSQKKSRPWLQMKGEGPQSMQDQQC